MSMPGESTSSTNTHVAFNFNAFRLSRCRRMVLRFQNQRDQMQFESKCKRLAKYFIMGWDALLLPCRRRDVMNLLFICFVIPCFNTRMSVMASLSLGQIIPIIYGSFLHLTITFSLHEYLIWSKVDKFYPSI